MYACMETPLPIVASKQLVLEFTSLKRRLRAAACSVPLKSIDRPLGGHSIIVAISESIDSCPSVTILLMIDASFKHFRFSTRRPANPSNSRHHRSVGHSARWSMRPRISVDPCLLLCSEDGQTNLNVHESYGIIHPVNSSLFQDFRFPSLSRANAQKLCSRSRLTPPPHQV
jgi:hypothetical protein